MQTSKKEYAPTKVSTKGAIITKGAYLRLYRKKRGYTQRWVSEQLQVSPNVSLQYRIG